MDPISTTITAPITITAAGSYPSPLDITSSGKVQPFYRYYFGYAGISSSLASASLTNDGAIYGGVSAIGGTGGAGVDFTATATLDNYGRITGGGGNIFSEGTASSGGIGVDMSGGTLENGDNIGGGGGIYGGNGGVGVEMTGGMLYNGTSHNNGEPDIHGGEGSGAGSGGTALIMDGGSVTNASGAFVIGGSSAGTGTGGIGAQLADGATLTNALGGDVSGGSGSGGIGGLGVQLGGNSLVTNDGSIVGGQGSMKSAAGASLANGASLTSGEYSTITGGSTVSGIVGDGVDLVGNGTLVNGGTIQAGGSQTTAGGTGVSIVAGGSLTTTAQVLFDGFIITPAGSITGGTSNSGAGGDGVSATGTASSAATVTNGGDITAGTSDGAAGIGVELSSFASIDNTGKIYGGLTDNATAAGGAGVVVNGSAEYNLNVAGALMRGGDDSGGTAGTGVELLSAGANLTNRGYIAGGNNGNYTTTGTAGIGAVVDSGATLTNLHDIFGGGVPNGGTGNVGVLIDGGRVIDAGTINGTEVTNYAYDTHAYSDSIEFGAASGSTLVLEQTGTLKGDLTGFKVGDTIQVDGTAPAGLTLSGSAAAGTYAIGTPENGTLYFSGKYTTDHFVFTSANGNTLITLAEGAACYLRGTHIRTPRGEQRIETLSIGDRVITMSGEACPIRWIGRRTYTAARIAGDRELSPVLIRAGALAEGIPWRDLRVSPDHALYVDGMLIAARDLVNSESIVQDVWCDPATYFHLEFDRHEVIYAEGALAESFVDDESRQRFDNAWEFAVLYPNAVSGSAALVAPRVEAGWELAAAARRVAARAGAARGRARGGERAGGVTELER